MCTIFGQGYLEKLRKAGEKNVPVDLALCIARDVARALVQLHSKHVIHRDIKSENILIDFERGADEMPIVKLCDFDRAVPLRSYLHTCCIGHLGVPPPDICVGTPRWMAPEVLRAMHKHKRYGMVGFPLIFFIVFSLCQSLVLCDFLHFPFMHNPGRCS